MPMHDWTRVPTYEFKDFHTEWIISLKHAINAVLPPGYRALAEQSSRTMGADVLTLQSEPPSPRGHRNDDLGEEDGGTVATLAPPRVRLTEQAELMAGFRQKRLAIRHVSEDRVVAIVEIVSPGNKSGDTEFKRFVSKAVRAIRADVNVLILDPWPPTPRDPNGIHGAIWPKLGGKPYTAPADRPLTFAAYEVADEDAGLGPRCYVEPSVVVEPLPEMPLFLSRDRYVSVPLESCYHVAFEGVSPRCRAALEEM